MMKRKVNRVGTSTLTVSLPSKWVKDKGIRQGDELEVVEIGGNLTLSTNGGAHRKTIELDISKYGVMTGRLVGALYKAGFDEIKLTFKDESSGKLVEKELAKGFLGLDMMHHAKHYCLLKSMASIKSEELDNSIRRMFYLVLDNARDALHAIKEKNFDELLVIADKDKNVNRFADFSRRLLNRYGYHGHEKTGSLYYILEETENIGDQFRDLARYLHEKKFIPDDAVLDMYALLVDFIEQFSDLFYKFNAENYRAFGERYVELHQQVESLCGSSSKKDLFVAAKLEALLYSIFNLNGPLMTMQFE